MLGPVAYLLSLLETDIRKAGERRFDPDRAYAHIINALMFVERTRSIDRLVSSMREAIAGLADVTAGEDERAEAMAALDALRAALKDAKPSEHAKARKVAAWWDD